MQATQHKTPRGTLRALDLLNFFMADVQTGFGPFVAVYLTAHKWTQVEIGLALTLGTVTSVASQVPAGAIVDAMTNKRLAAGASDCLRDAGRARARRIPVQAAGARGRSPARLRQQRT